MKAPQDQTQADELEHLRKKIYEAIHDGVTLSIDGGQPYLAYTDEAEDKIVEMIYEEKQRADQRAIEVLEELWQARAKDGLKLLNYEQAEWVVQKQNSLIQAKRLNLTKKG